MNWKGLLSCNTLHLSGPSTTTTTSGELSLKSQKRLLEPFKLLSNAGQRCNIVGAVNADLALAVVKAMTPPVLWNLAIGWKTYDLLQTIRAMGSQNVQSGDLDGARRIYHFAENFGMRCVESGRLDATSDENFRYSFSRLVVVCQTNNRHVNLLAYDGADEDAEPLERLLRSSNIDLYDRPTGPYMTNLIAAYNTWFYGMSLFLVRAFREAADALKDAASYMKEVDDHASSRRAIRDSGRTMNKWANSKFAKSQTRQDHEDAIATLIRMLPKEPLTAEPYRECTEDARVERFHYILDKLSYAPHRSKTRILF